MEFKIKDFREIFSEKAFALPIRWDGVDFLATLRMLFQRYCESVSTLFYHDDAVRELFPIVSSICDRIIKSIEKYLDGKPSEAYSDFNNLFKNDLMSNQFSLYNTFFDPNLLQSKSRSNRPKLFRARKVDENRIFKRSEIFHIPFNLRNKVATSRYSIAGYPSLYLSSSLELCLEEMEYDINPGRYICSRFELYDESTPRIIELGIKPQDFLIADKAVKGTKRFELIDKQLLTNSSVIKNYYLWYPLIAACSFIRINRSDPFAAEYIVPQLLMQSIRTFRANNVFMGIRYFSCASEYSSELGFNYVFPTHYDGNKGQLCSVLSKSFLLTKPLFLNEYKEINFCELALRNSKTDFVNKV